jgi:hypothetical protein
MRKIGLKQNNFGFLGLLLVFYFRILYKHWLFQSFINMSKLTSSKLKSLAKEFACDKIVTDRKILMCDLCECNYTGGRQTSKRTDATTH